MPHYYYQCKKCDDSFLTFHKMNESLTRCEKCNEETLVRVPSMIYIRKPKQNEKQKVGEQTKQFIEESREDLQEQKKEVKREYKKE